jgi:hypothetical protein
MVPQSHDKTLPDSCEPIFCGEARPASPAFSSRGAYAFRESAFVAAKSQLSQRIAGRVWLAIPKPAERARCGEPDAISNATFYSRSHDAVIRVYDAAGNVIDTHKRASPYLSAVFGPDGTMSFWKRESLRREGAINTYSVTPQNLADAQW